MLSAEEYRSAVRALEAHSGTKEQIAFYERQYQKAHKRELYFYDLANAGGGSSGLTRGLSIAVKLVGDGWTPPEGLEV